MTDKTEERFISIETILAEQERNIEELSDEIIRQAKLIDRLIIENKALKEAIENQSVIRCRGCFSSFRAYYYCGCSAGFFDGSICLC